MANIKISELNELSKVDRTDIVPIVDVSANETKKVLVDNLIEKNVELLAISDTAPSVFDDGDKYYNTSTKKIYTAVDESWSETGETPLDGLFYIVFNEQSSYAWNGSDLVSVGGGKEDIVISDTEPTDPDVKIWINTGEVQNLGSELHVGSEIDSKVRTNIIKGKNLFGNYTIINGWITETTMRVNTNQGNRLAFIQCQPNTQYTISRSVTTNSFRVSDYTSIPTMISSNVDYTIPTAIENNTGTSITYTTSSTAKYLIIHYGQTEDTNLNQSLATIQVEKGSTATTYQAYITPTINVDGEDIYSVPKVLWANPNPTSSFAGQQITLSDSLDNYDYYEVIYYNTTSLTQTFTSGKIKNDKMTTLNYFAGLEANTYISIRYRAITSVNASQGKITFGDAYNKYVHEQTLTTNNILAIPYKIIGYKE